MRKSGEDNPQFERDTINGAECYGNDEVEGSEPTGNRYQPAETSCNHQEKGIYDIKGIQIRKRPHGGSAHKPVHGPDDSRLGEKQPFVLHLHAAAYSLKKPAADGKELAAKRIVVPVPYYQEYYRRKDDGCRKDKPPHAE